MLRILSGGAAQALVAKMKGERDVHGTFGAVGAMRDKLLAGEPADLVILSRALVEQLAASGHAGGSAPIAPGAGRDALPAGRADGECT